MVTFYGTIIPVTATTTSGTIADIVVMMRMKNAVAVIEMLLLLFL